MMHTRSRAAAMVIAATALGATALTATTVMAQTPAQAQTRSLPTFAVDPSWPKVPPQWKLGDVSSMASDAQGNIWVLHRPRTLKGDDFAKAAPPVMVFDQAGNYVKSWGGDGPGYDWPQREHGIYIDSKGFVWLGGNSCPENGLARLKPVADDALLKFTQDGKFVMQIGHSNQSKGNADTANVHRAADVQVYPPTNELFVADGYGNHRVIDEQSQRNDQGTERDPLQRNVEILERDERHRQHQRNRHVRVPGENSETHAAQEREQVPLVKKRFLDVFSQAHGGRNPSRVPRSCRSSASAFALFKLADQITKIIHRLLKFLFPLHLLRRPVRGLDGQFVQDRAR